MKTWEAMKLLDEGMKIRHNSWGKGRYLYKFEGKVVDENCNLRPLKSFHDAWELYIEDTRKEFPERMNWLRDIYRNYEKSGKTFNCVGLKCSDCPLSSEYRNISLCLMIRQTMPEIKENFKIEEER